MTVYDALSPYYYFEYFRCSIVVNTIRRGAARKYATHSDLADFIASHHRRWCVFRGSRVNQNAGFVIRDMFQVAICSK